MNQSRKSIWVMIRCDPNSFCISQSVPLFIPFKMHFTDIVALNWIINSVNIPTTVDGQVHSGQWLRNPLCRQRNNYTLFRALYSSTISVNSLKSSVLMYRLFGERLFSLSKTQFRFLGMYLIGSPCRSMFSNSYIRPVWTPLLMRSSAGSVSIKSFILPESNCRCWK